MIGTRSGSTPDPYDEIQFIREGRGVLGFNWYRETGRRGHASAFGFKDVQVIEPAIG